MIADDDIRTGVYFADAPDGYEALTLYVRGRRMIRLEIARDLYCPGWKRWLEQLTRVEIKKSLELIG